MCSPGLKSKIKNRNSGIDKSNNNIKKRVNMMIKNKENEKSSFFSVKNGLIAVTFLFFILFIALPLALVFSEALKKGIELYFKSITDKEARSAIMVTLMAASIAVPLNTIFGISTAWLMSRFDFRGKTIYNTILDIPFAVSPVIAGLMFVLLLGRRSAIGQFLMEHGIKIIFETPGIIIATIFITLPFVARELIPLMQEQGKEEEEAALSLGASGWTTFFKITLPNIKWGLIYGIILCNARAIGEFGAVSVVSGHIRGKTNTLPLHVEILYNEYQFTAAFAVATLLVFIAVITLIVKNIAEKKHEESIKMAE